jgi:hypothetical protein
MLISRVYTDEIYTLITIPPFSFSRKCLSSAAS